VSEDPTRTRWSRATQVKLAATAAAVIGLVLAVTAGMAHAASERAQGCKDLILVTYLVSQGDRIAAVPFKVRPCGKDNPKTWQTGVSAPSSNAAGDNIGWLLQGLDVRFEGPGANSRTAASAHYKGVAKLTQRTPNVPLVPIAPVSLRSITVAIKFTVFHQKGTGTGQSKNVNLKDFIRVDGTWSSHPDWVQCTYKKGGIVNGG